MYSSTNDISLNSITNTIDLRNKIVKVNPSIYCSGTIISREIQKFPTYNMDYKLNPIIVYTSNIITYTNSTISSYIPKSINKNSKVIIQAFFNAYPSGGLSWYEKDSYGIILYIKGATSNTELDRTFMFFYGYIGGGSRMQTRPLIGQTSIPPNTSSPIDCCLFSYKEGWGAINTPNVDNVTFTFTQVITD